MAGSASLRDSLGLQRPAPPHRQRGEDRVGAPEVAVDHYDVQVEDGTVLRLCFDWIDRAWRIDAVYD